MKTEHIVLGAAAAGAIYWFVLRKRGGGSADAVPSRFEYIDRSPAGGFTQPFPASSAPTAIQNIRAQARSPATQAAASPAVRKKRGGLFGKFKSLAKGAVGAAAGAQKRLAHEQFRQFKAGLRYTAGEKIDKLKQGLVRGAG